MELGFADFSSLHARNILVGFCFILYASLLFIIILPISATIYLCFLILKSSNRLLIGLLRFTLLILLIFMVTSALVYLVGILVGFLFPWGRSWEDGGIFEGSAWALSFMMSDVRVGYSQFMKAYWYPKAIVASLLIFSSLIPLIHYLKNFFASNFLPKNKMIFFNLTIATTLLLFGYSIEVYPNIRYNLGGGQPKIVALHIETKDRNLADLMGAKPAIENDDAVIITGPVALWYQDSNFLYLSSLKKLGQGAESVLAIDSSAVHAIHYQPGYVEVDDGSKIIKVEIENN